MQMEDCLACVGTNVVDGPKPVLEVAFARDPGRYDLAITNQLRVRFGCLINADDMFFGDNQDVRRRLRFNVLKDERFVVFINLFCWDFAGDDFAEETIGHNNEMLTKSKEPDRRRRCRPSKSLLSIG
jgi:hypothetical protein